jgi:AraC-like DNA-binding protein
VLTANVLAKTPELEVRDVRCRSHRSSWSAPEEGRSFVVVLVRRGCFWRRVEGSESMLDSAVVYFSRPGEEQQIAHPCDGGDACTAISLSDHLLAGLWGGEPGLPDRPAFTTPGLDLEQRLLVSGSGGVDESEVTERVLSLVAGVLEQSRPERVAAGRPATAAARRRLIAAARGALAADPAIGLVALARQLAVSPHHLSRLFSAQTGETVTRYRNRLRVRLVLERLREGERSLARLAAELGFADQAHLTRVVRSEVGAPPSHLRVSLSAATPR